MPQLATAAPERIMLRVDRAKKAAFLEMLSAPVKRYVENAPQNVPLTDDDVMAEVKAVRKRATVQH